MFFLLTLCLLFPFPNQINATAPFKVIVPLPPFLSPLKAIVQDRATYFVLIPEGKNPHYYDISIRNSLAMAQADIYLSSGQNFFFEKKFLTALQHHSHLLQIVDISKGIHKVHADCSSCHSSTYDPHIWMSLDNMARIAFTIKEFFSNLDPQFATFYEKNYLQYLDQLSDLQSQFNLLDSLKKRSYYVFHSAWSYFDEEFDLHSISLEVEGKPLSIRRLSTIQQQKEGLPILFYSPYDNPRSVDQSSQHLQCESIKVDILSEDYLKTMTIVLNAFKKFCSYD